MKDFYGQVSIASIGNEEVTVNDLIFHLKSDLGQSVIYSAIHEQLIRTASDEMGIRICDEELQQAADDFRRKQGLYSAQETFEWLEDNGMTVEELERKLEVNLLRERVKARVANENSIQEFFWDNVSDFQRAKVGLIVVESQRTAYDIIDQLIRGEAEFIDLALKHSVLEDVKQNGGFIGNIYRHHLPYAVDEAVFGEDAPMLVGPVEVGSRYYVVNVFEKNNADMDEEAREACSQILFDEFLRERALASGVYIHILPGGVGNIRIE